MYQWTRWLLASAVAATALWIGGVLWIIATPTSDATAADESATLLLDAELRALSIRVGELSSTTEWLDGREPALSSRIDELSEQLEALSARLDALSDPLDAPVISVQPPLADLTWTVGDEDGVEADLSLYIVQEGDIAFRIARLFGATIEELAEANGLTVEELDSIQIGDTLTLPRP